MFARSRFNRAPATIVLYAGGLLIGLALVSIPSSSIHLQVTHGLTDRQYGHVFIPQLVFAIGGALLAGPVVKRVSLKTMYAVALMAFGLSQLALALSAMAEPATAVILIMTCTALFGFGFGFGGGPLNGLVADLFPRNSAPAITGLHLMAGVGLTAGPLYFRVLENHGHWILAPFGLALVATVLLVTVPVLVPGTIRLPASANTPTPAASGYFWLMIAIAFLYALVEGAFSNWAVIFVSIEKSTTRDSGAVALSTFWAGLTVGRLLTTLCVARIGALRLWMLLPVLMFAAFLVLPTLDGANALIAGYGFAGLACSAFFPLMVAIASEPFPEHLSWIASMLTASLMFGVGVGSYVIGEAAGAIAIAQLYHYFSCVPLVALMLMWLCKRPWE